MLNFGPTLVIAAHPDDEILGVGGTIARLRKEDVPVTTLIVTDGCSSQYPDQPEIVQKKAAHAKQAAQDLGVEDLVMLDFPDMRLDGVPHIELNQAIQDVVSSRSIQTIFTHHSGDVNMDHQALFRSTLVVARPMAGNSVMNLLSYHVNSSTEWGSRSSELAFVPNFFFDITETMEQKVCALHRYEDEMREMPHPRSEGAVRARAATFGTECGVLCAEAFTVLFSRA